MFVDHRRARFGLAKVLGLVHIFLACVLLPLADAGHRSNKLANYSGLSRRSPSLSYRISDENHRDGPSSGTRSFSNRRIHHRTVKKDESYVPERGSVSSRHRVHYRGASVEGSRAGDWNANVNSNSRNGAGNVYMDEIDFRENDASDQGVGYNSDAVKLEAKLYTSHQFRVNMIIVFGQILKAPNNILTIDQFTSLNIILQALIHKQVYTFNLLPILQHLQGADKETQFKLVLQALADNIPKYLVSACAFWFREIEDQFLDIDQLIDSIELPHDFLTGIDPELIEICKVKVAAEEMEPFDEPSEVIKNTLGLVFVKIFNRLRNNELILSQKLFGAILVNLPIGKMNPVLEEYINLIWDLVKDNLLPNWDEVARKIEYGNPYQLVNSVMKELLMEEMLPRVLKHAYKYIIIHLKEVPSTFSDEYYSDMQILLNNEMDVELMFSMIEDDIVIPELSELRDQLLAYIKQMDIEQILQGMNKYAYQKPIDLLIAFLVRIQRLTQSKDIGNTVAKLLSILISKKEFGSFTVTVSADVELVMLLDFLNVPDSDPAISALAKKIQLYLEGDPNLMGNLPNLVSKKDKSKCQRPIQCLLYLLTETVNPDTVKELGVPSELIKMIQTLINHIQKAIRISAKCEPHDVLSVEHTEILHDLVDVTSKPIPLAPGSPPEKPTYPPIPLLISADYDEIVFKPDNPDPHSGEEPQIVYPTIPGQDKLSTDGWMIIKPKPLEWPDLKPKPTMVPEPGPVPVPTVKPILVPEIIIPWSKKPLISTTPPSIVHPSPGPSDVVPQPEDEPIIAPNLSYDKTIYIVFPKDDGPPHTSLTKPSGTLNAGFYIEFPSIQKLLQEFNPYTPFDPNELPDLPEISKPLKEILGPNYIEELLGKYVDKKEYPTVISLVNDVLDHALENPKVQADLDLVLNIKLYVKAIEYLSITALFPVVVDSQNVSSNVIHVTFDPDNPNANSVDTVPPARVPAGFLTLTIYHPKYLVQQVDPLDPYGSLLPKPSEGGDNPIQELINDGSLQGILGPDFDPHLYPNKGTLMTTVLQKLIVSHRVTSDRLLLEKLNAYLNSIKAVALHNKIPKDYGTHILEVQQKNTVNWQPDIASLIMALPPAHNHIQLQKLKLIKDFLQTPNLLELLNIDNPSYLTTRGTLLKMIFKAAIRGKKVRLDSKTLHALIYYQHKILMDGYGALPIVWVWVQMFIIREEVPLGEIIESVIDYDSLPDELKISYNDLMTYLSENPQFLEGDDTFPFEKYPTEGSFLAGLFTHFLKKPDMSPKAKQDITQIIPHIKLTGPGAAVMKHVTIDDLTNGNINKNGVSVLLNG